MKVSLRELYQAKKDKDINLLDNNGDISPSSTSHGSFNFSSPKRSRRDIEKRVVTVPIKDVKSSRYKGDLTLPSDSWSWRKYGQKPIKGSPYPRGYYRCSSSKGCPARKQVERSHSDPKMIVITYSHDHHHSTWQTSKTKNHHTTNNKKPPTSIEDECNKNENKNKSNLGDNIISESNTSSDQGPMEPPLAPNMTDGFGWFDSMDYHGQDHGFMANNCGNIMSEFDHIVNNNSKMFAIKEEEEVEELFAGLGELPECSAVFSLLDCIN